MFQRAVNLIPKLIPEFIFISSLALPAIEYNPNGKIEYLNGLVMFMMSPLGIFALNFAGLANISLFFGRLLASTKPLVSVTLSLISLLLALSLLLYDQMPMGSAGSYKFHVSYGYYVWLGSMLAAFIHAISIYETKKNI